MTVCRISVQKDEEFIFMNMDNEYDYGVREVFMNIQQAARWIDPVFKIGAVGTVMLVQFLYRMVKERKLNTKEFVNVESFLKATEGKYDIMNVPVTENFHTETGTKGQMTVPDLDALGVRYVVMPDLDKEDGYLQIAVYQPDRDKFAAWYERYLVGQMKGGEKHLQDLRNLTSGKTSIVSVPLEGKEDILEEDFQALGINYSRLADLHVGDGDIQIAVANSDLPKVEHWYHLYKTDMMNQGKEVKDLSVVSMEQYQATGQMKEEDYIKSANQELKAANEKYEGREAGEIERAVVQKSAEIKNENSAAYEALKNNPNYIQIWIDRKTLVEQSQYTEGMKQLEKEGLFASRIPGTWGEREKVLILGTEEVFLTNEGQTYLGFLEKDKAAWVMDAKTGKTLSMLERPTGAELFQKYYSKSDKQYHNVKDIQQEITKTAVKQAESKNLFPEKIPSVPIKAR